MRTPAVTVTVYDKAYAHRGPIRGLLSASASFRWNAASTAKLSVISSDRRIPDLRTPGCRAVVQYWADRDAATPTLSMSGTVAEETGSPRSGQKTAVVFTIQDDWVDILQSTLGWVAPIQPISNQGAETAYYKSSGPAETVAKAIIGANASRAGKPLTVPASMGRGSNITVQIRMHPLVDRLFPAVDDAGIGLQVLQQGAGRTLLVTARTSYPEVLTDATGEVVEGAYTLTAPTVTRLICGASGKQEARVFVQQVDAAREAAWGLRLEEFLDVRNIKYPSGSFAAEVAAKAAERLAEGGPKSGCSAKLQESRRLVIGDRIGLGSEVEIQLGDGPVVTDIVREIQVSTTDAGISVNPLVGGWDESGDRKLWNLIASGNKRSRDLGVE